METYNYREQITNDIIDYINENEIDFYELHDNYQLRTDLENKLFIEDTVTGKGSGSYTSDTWKAEENICHNIDLLKEAYEELGYTEISLNNLDAEKIDVTIRCYLLQECLEAAIHRLINKDMLLINSIDNYLNKEFPNNDFCTIINYKTLKIYSKSAITTSNLYDLEQYIYSYINTKDCIISIHLDEIKLLFILNRG